MRDTSGYVIVIGASAGGINTLKQLVSSLEKGLNAALCVVLHVSSTQNVNTTVQALQKETTLKCMAATVNLPLRNDHIYFAPADHHLIIKKNKMVLGRGPKENRWRPSIDVTFRSAAAAFGSKTIGIILTGMLTDGVAGMSAIKRSGGTSIVLDPDEAEYPDMPLAVLANVKTDYCLSLSAIMPVLKKLTGKKVKLVKAPEDVVIESHIAEEMATGFDIVAKLGNDTPYSCPDCGGNLWKIKDGKLTRYRCHIGHTYTEPELMSKQTETLEATLWVALRMMEERKHLLVTLAGKNSKKGFNRLARDSAAKAAELEDHISKLKQLLFSSRQLTQRNGSMT